MKKLFILLLFVAGCTTREDQANLWECADKYRVCLHQKGEHCVAEAGKCRLPYSTSSQEWALIIGNAGMLTAADAEDSASIALGFSVGTAASQAGKK